MLPARRKLRDKRDFNRVYKYGRRISCPFFILWSLVVNQKQLTKFAVVASIKKLGKATARNRGRRRLWALLKTELEAAPSTGYWLIFNLNKSIITAKWPELRTTFKQIFRKVR